MGFQPYTDKFIVNLHVLSQYISVHRVSDQPDCPRPRIFWDTRIGHVGVQNPLAAIYPAILYQGTGGAPSFVLSLRCHGH